MDEQRKAVRTMQIFIREHIDEEIEIDELARAVSFSAPYVRKLFIKYLGISPAAYIRRFKLAISALKLRDEHIQIFSFISSFVNPLPRERSQPRMNCVESIGLNAMQAAIANK